MSGQKKTVYVSDENLDKVAQIQRLAPDAKSIPKLLSEMIETYRLMRLCGFKKIKPAAWVALECSDFENLAVSYDDDGQKLLDVKPELMQKDDSVDSYPNLVRKLLSSKK